MIQGEIDYCAAGLQILCCAVCLCNLSLGKTVINTLTVLKVVLVIFLICIGIIPAFLPDSTAPAVFDSYDSFFPNGMGGTITGSSLLFFGFIGFDEVCCMAARANNPKQVMRKYMDRGSKAQLTYNDIGVV